MYNQKRTAESENTYQFDILEVGFPLQSTQQGLCLAFPCIKSRWIHERCLMRGHNSVPEEGCGKKFWELKNKLQTIFSCFWLFAQQRRWIMVEILFPPPSAMDRGNVFTPSVCHLAKKKFCQVCWSVESVCLSHNFCPQFSSNRSEFFCLCRWPAKDSNTHF